jgi:hypothetical protein
VCAGWEDAIDDCSTRRPSGGHLPHATPCIQCQLSRRQFTQNCSLTSGCRLEMLMPCLGHWPVACCSSPSSLTAHTPATRTISARPSWLRASGHASAYRSEIAKEGSRLRFDSARHDADEQEFDAAGCQAASHERIIALDRRQGHCARGSHFCPRQRCISRLQPSVACLISSKG